MFGCKDVIPPKLRNFDWKGTDNDSWLMRQKKKIQYWLAMGPRGNHWYCHTREVPKTLFARYGSGELRYENTTGTKFATETELSYPCGCCGLNYSKLAEPYYISRIQPWSRWGIVLQWPLYFNCWFIYLKRDVISPPRYKSSFGITKIFTFGIGYKRDSDRWYIPTMNIGGNFE